MVEPLSIAASIAGLIGLASELTKTCYGYYTKVKNAPVQVQDVINEIKLLRRALSDLEDIYDRRSGPLPALDHFLKELSECEDKLAAFGLKIDTEFRHPHRVIKRLEWPFRGPEVRAFLADVQRYRAAFEAAKANAILDVVLDVQSDTRSEASRQDAFRKGKSHFWKRSLILSV
jgi:Fungal N-terminal domain of STAND proteins